MHTKLVSSSIMHTETYYLCNIVTCVVYPNSFSPRPFLFTPYPSSSSWSPFLHWNDVLSVSSFASPSFSFSCFHRETLTHSFCACIYRIDLMRTRTVRTRKKTRNLHHHYSGSGSGSGAFDDDDDDPKIYFDFFHHASYFASCADVSPPSGDRPRGSYACA